MEQSACQPIYFLEVQGFPDEVIYFRIMREVVTYFEQRPKLKDNEWQAAVLWLNNDDDPGFGTLRLLAQQPEPRLIAMDLVELLRKLPETSLALNVLRPLLAKTELEVRTHVVQWVDYVRQASDLDANTEEKLIAVMSQLIEQKFRRLNYKELSKMLRLTPFHETESFREALKDERVETLVSMIEVKFGISPETAEAIAADLKQLDLNTLKALIRQLLRLNTFEQLEFWIADHLPERTV